MVTCCELYDYKNEEYIALGLKDGSVLIKLSENILNNSIVDHIKPGQDKTEKEKETSLQEKSLDTSVVSDKVTFISFIMPPKLQFGSKEGRLTFYNIQKKETFSFVLDQKIMKQVVSILEPHPKIPDIKKHLYYVLTHGNLYVLTKSEH